MSQLTSMLARSSDHTFTSIGDLELCGVPEAVPAMTVDWEPVQISGAVPMPDRLKPDMDLDIAGRAQELEALGQALKGTESGDKRTTFLAGEPGIGKTRLSSELAVDAHGRGALALYGRCDEELSLPYQPWVEAVGYLFETADADLLEEVVRLHGPELSLLVPSIRRRFPDVEVPTSTDAETERYRLLQAVTSMLAIISENDPVIDVVGQRIARLGEESLKSLRAAAVIGKEFDLELLAEITGTDEDDLLDLLEAAIAAGVLAEVPGRDERFRFMHTVARNTLEGELSDGRKRRMHRKIAEALEASIRLRGHPWGSRLPGGRGALPRRGR